MLTNITINRSYSIGSTSQLRSIKNYELYLSSEDLDNLKQVNASYSSMILDVKHLRHLNFSLLMKPRLNYSTQECISQDSVNLATACLIHYGLNPGMMTGYLKGEYVGKSRDVQKIINKVTPFVCETDIVHIKRVLTQGCPSRLVFDEARENKLFVIRKGIQHTFLQHPEVAKKAMNKIEKKPSHCPPELYCFFHPTSMQHCKEYTMNMESSE